jgi:pSer/pThr/pTyr-binding forkhead associated (FHA) protein
LGDFRLLIQKLQLIDNQWLILKHQFKSQKLPNNSLKLSLNLKNPLFSQIEFLKTMKIIRFGRSADNQVIINDPMVSATHLAITQTPKGEIFAQDLGSSNGSLVNQIPLGKVPFLLQKGDVIKIGQTTLAWEVYFNEEPETLISQEASVEPAELESVNYSQISDNQIVMNELPEKPTPVKPQIKNQTFDQQNNRILLWAVFALLFLLLLFLLIWYARNVVKPSLNLGWVIGQSKFLFIIY